MSSIQVSLSAGVWTQITTTDKNGSIRHHGGSSPVVYVESDSEPASFDSSTPVMEETDRGDDWPYWGVSETNFIWALAVNGNAVLVVSPRGY